LRYEKEHTRMRARGERERERKEEKSKRRQTRTQRMKRMYSITFLFFPTLQPSHLLASPSFLLSHRFSLLKQGKNIRDELLGLVKNLSAAFAKAAETAKKPEVAKVREERRRKEKRNDKRSEGRKREGTALFLYSLRPSSTTKPLRGTLLARQTLPLNKTRSECVSCSLT
jgi:hypothetical protein